MDSCKPLILLRSTSPLARARSRDQPSSILRCIVLNYQSFLIPVCNMHGLYAGQILIAVVTSLSRPKSGPRQHGNAINWLFSYSYWCDTTYKSDAATYLNIPRFRNETKILGFHLYLYKTHYIINSLHCEQMRAILKDSFERQIFPIGKPDAVNPEPGRSVVHLGLG